MPANYSHLLPQDTTFPNAARIYDYTVGGSFNVAADREAAEYMFYLVPSTRKWVVMLREFLQVVARELYEDGFTQFLDLGSGLPTESHIHQVLPPEVRVVYCDIDPLTVQYGQALVADVPNAHYLEGDIQALEQFLQSEAVSSLIDRSKKVAIGLNGVVTFFQADEIQRIARVLYDWAPEGSEITATFETKDEGAMTPAFDQFEGMFAQTGSPMYFLSLDTYREAMQPWQVHRMETLADYLGKPEGYITEADREGVGIEFYAARFRK